MCIRDSRWSAKHALVLADDPGSSVLTVTSQGMVGLTREYVKRKKFPDRPGAVVLWRDVKCSRLAFTQFYLKFLRFSHQL